MTHAEWLSSADPRAMLQLLTHEANPDYGEMQPRATPLVSDRKLRLFACAVFRRMRVAYQQRESSVLTSEPWVEAAEAQADGVPLPEKYLRATDGPYYWFCMRADAKYAASRACEIWTDLDADKAGLLRRIVGDPFRRYPADSWVMGGDKPCPQWPDDFPWLRWNGGAVPALARQMYDARDFSQMGVLHDMLVDSGCEQPDILHHLRGEQRCPVCLGVGETATTFPDVTWRSSCIDCAGSGWVPLGCSPVRGDWALDLILGLK